MFWYLWAGTLLNRIGSFVLPFLALFLTARRGLSPAEATLFVALYGGGGFVASFAGGLLADRLGRRATLLISLLGGATAMLAVPWIRATVVLGVAVFVLGGFTELYRPAVSAAVADLVEDVDRPRAFALLHWAANVGAAVAPVLAGLLATRSYTALFVVDALTMTAYALLVRARVPETHPLRQPGASAPSSGTGTGRGGLRVALRDRHLVALCVLAFLLSSVFFQAFTTLPLSMRADGLGEAAYGLAIATNGALVVLVSLPLAGVVSRYPPALVMAVAATLIGAGFGLVGPAASMTGYAGAIVVWTLGEVAFVPVAPTLVARLAPPALRGAYQGAYHAAWGLALLAGPAVGGQVFEYLGETALWTGCLGVGLVAGGGFLLMRRYTRTLPPRT